MKVKKPTSKRKSTKLQKGIQKKIAAHNRKQKKLSKKDVTWKSRQPKDPGIPNSFPFKAQLLEEIEMNRQRDAEERERRKEELRQQAIAQGATAEDLVTINDQIDMAANQNRLSALLESAQQAAADYESDDEEMDLEDEQDEELGGVFEDIQKDTSRKAFEKHFKQVVESCDVLIYVLDARNPDGTRSKHVEETILAHPNKRLIFALNKIDLVPEDVLKRWVEHLQRSFPTVPLAASAPAANAHTFNHAGFTRVNTATKLLESLKKYAAESSLKRAVTVGVIGYPNVGKSSVINALLARHGNNSRACPTGAQAGITTDVRRVKVDNKLNVMDCPGIVFPSASGKKLSQVEEHARLILLNAMPPKYMDDCRPAVTRLLKRLQKNPQQAELFIKYYDLPPLVQTPFDAFVTNVLVHVARKLGRLGKGGVPDLGSAALAIVTDWRDGRVSGWAEPPADKPAASVEVVSQWAQEFDLDGILGGLLEENN